MKLTIHFLRSVIIAFALMHAGSAIAENSKIGVVDFIAAISGSDEVKQKNAALEKELKQESEKARTLGETIQGIDQKLNKESMTMSAKERDKLMQERETKVFEFRSLQQLLQKRFQEEQQQILYDMQPALMEAVEAEAKEKGLDMVVSSQAVIWVEPAYDLTQAVTERMNKK